MDVQTVITGITVGTTSNGRQKFEAACADGVTRTIWEAPIANAMQPFIGQPITLDVSQTPKRDGMGFWEKINGFGGQQQMPQQPMQPTYAPVPQPYSGAATPPGAPTVDAPVFPPTPAPEPRESMTPTAIARITKLACINSAAIVVGGVFAGSMEDAAGHVEQLAQRLYRIARSHEALSTNNTGSEGQIIPQAMTPAQVAAPIPGVTVGAPVLDAVPDDTDDWA